MRGRMNPVTAQPHLLWKLNEIPSSAATVEIVESKSEKLKIGSIFLLPSKWQEEVIVNETDDLVPLSSNDPNLISILSTAGLTAHIGLFRVGKLKAGETLVISGAAGSVGILVGQIGKILGCHVVGLCGSDDKVSLLQSLHFDHALNYHTPDLSTAIRTACPRGIDIYFDNVGGPASDIIFDNLNKFGRVVVCGQIALYNEPEGSAAREGPRLWMKMIYKCLKVEGFIVSDYKEEFEGARRELSGWYESGKLKVVSTVEEGLGNLPKAFVGLFSGVNTGKQLVKVAK